MEHFLNTSPDAQGDTSVMGAPDIAPRVRIFSVIWRLVIAIAIIGGAGYLAKSWIADRPEPVQRQARERSFTVAVQEANRADHRADINTFGEIVASRTIDVRAQVSGQVVELSPKLVAGGEVSKGELLLRIDSFNYDGALADANSMLADARLQFRISEEQLKLETLKRDAAATQLALAQRDLERAKSLAAVGTVTDKGVDDRELIVSQREQAVTQSQSNIEVQKAGLERQQSAIARAEWLAAQAQRAVENTRIYAPFDGVVISENAELGRLYSNSEIIAQFYEQNSLEARFTLTDRQYGQLLSDGLNQRPVEVVWNIEPSPIKLSGVIERTSAQVNAALGGVEVFAALQDTTGTGVRPGAYVTVSVEGPTYKQTFRVAETAVYENTHLYVIEDRRLKRVDVNILSRLGDDLIVAGDLAEGAQIVTSRLAQAGEGLLVTIEGEEATPPSTNADGQGAQSGDRNSTGAAQTGERPLPPGAVRNEDGSVTFPNGRTRFPDGRVIDADGKPVQGRDRGNAPQNGAASQ